MEPTELERVLLDTRIELLAVRAQAAIVNVMFAQCVRILMERGVISPEMLREIVTGSLEAIKGVAADKSGPTSEYLSQHAEEIVQATFSGFPTPASDH